MPTLPLNPYSGSPIDDASVLLDAWDEEMADENLDADGEQQQMSFSPNNINEGAIPHEVDPADVHEHIIKGSTSPRITGRNVLPPSPVILVPDTQQSEIRYSRNTTPSLPAIQCLATNQDKMQDASETPDKPCVGISTLRPTQEVATTQTTPQDTNEVSEATLLETTFNYLDRGGST